MLSTALAFTPGAVGVLLLPDQVFLKMYEYCMPHRRPPFGP